MAEVDATLPLAQRMRLGVSTAHIALDSRQTSPFTLGTQIGSSEQPQLLRVYADDPDDLYPVYSSAPIPAWSAPPA